MIPVNGNKKRAKINMMKKVTWISLALLIILWYFFAKFWQYNPSDNFKFSDRDKTMVFPTPKTLLLNLSTPSSTLVE